MQAPVRYHTTNLPLNPAGIHVSGFCNGVPSQRPEVASPHSGEALGEKQLGQVGASSARNPSGMNGSCDSHS
ncbi:MAG: hypothetical protein WB755_17930, partial [Terriglobales bacterium]